ncbi:MAG: TadE/TadG family type IV pilus assembly protein [Acidimicrobiia bacterium]
MRRFHHRADRGATLIEFALVVPLLALLAFGTAEIAFAFTAANRVESAVAQAGRVAASSGAQRDADVNILLNLQSALGPEALANVDRVVIFKADSASGAVPENCVKPRNSTDETGILGICNTYNGNTVRTLTSAAVGFSGPCSGLAKDRYWCPSNRNDSLSDPPDWIGVWVRTKHVNQTGTYFGDFTLTETAVYRIQPDFTG